MGLETYFENSDISKVQKGEKEGFRRQKPHWDKLANTNNNMYHGRQKEKSEVHSSEQKYCLTNGIRWKKLLKTKKYLHLYSDITGWDDSAGKEAFDNAKARYWAQINGLQPEIPLPDPDMLIDIVNPEALMSDLYLKLHENLHGSISDDEADSDDCGDLWGEGGVILWDMHYANTEEEVVWVNVPTGPEDNRTIRPTGWGDNDPDSIKPTGWGDNDPDSIKRVKSIKPTGSAVRVMLKQRGPWNGVGMI